MSESAIEVVVTVTENVKRIRVKKWIEAAVVKKSIGEWDSAQSDDNEDWS